MTKSNKTLLKALLTFEYELGKTHKALKNISLFSKTDFNLNPIYDLFEVIISAFNIPETNYDYLYNLLNKLYLNQSSVKATIKAIDVLNFILCKLY